MKVTVIVPIYQVEQYIGDCLNSVASQTYQGDIECLLVDDCGSDGSMALVNSFVESYTGKIQFKILHHACNRGLSAARNTGIVAATGDYLFFLDSDDELLPDCLSLLMEAVREKEYDMVIGDVVVVGDDRLKCVLTLKFLDGEVLRQPRIRYTYRHKWNAVAWNKLYRTDFVRENGLHFVEGLLFEDELWNFKVSFLLAGLRIVKHPTYIYRIRGDSITSAMDLQARVAHLTEIVKGMSRYVKEMGVPYDHDIHQRLQYFFSMVLEFAIRVGNYDELYRELRPYTKVSFGQYLQFDGRSVFGLLRDFHYFLPTACGACWMRMFFDLVGITRRIRRKFRGYKLFR